MAFLTRAELRNSFHDSFTHWQNIGITLPRFDIEAMVERTRKSPRWMHLAPSNLYRAMVAPLQQELLELGAVEEGMVAVETHDRQVIDEIYHLHDNLSIRVVMYPDGKNDLMIVASIADSLFADAENSPEYWQRTLDYFSDDSLQMVSITCTEKGYNIGRHNKPGASVTEGNILATLDYKNGPDAPKHIMGKVASFAYHRYKSGQAPIAFVSMDNCPENGLKFSNAVMSFAKEWYNRGFVESGFLKYMESNKVTFPWTMIDRITPRPALKVKEMLEEKGIQGMDIITTEKGTVIAPFVNTEHISYLAIQDIFPNGRPPLEKVGVIFTDSTESIEKYEKMKVGACLNPNQTTLAIFGCLLNHKRIYDAATDPLLKELLYRQSYKEALPVVEHPGKVEPAEFLREVLEERLPNPNIPDTPARIITDTSQKVEARYGNTIIAHGDNAKNLTYIPLAIAGWCRYLMGIDDNGQEMNYNPAVKPPWNKWSPDLMLKELTGYVSEIRLGKPETVGDRLQPILSDEILFGINLYKVGVGQKVESYFKEMIARIGAVGATLEKYIH